MPGPVAYGQVAQGGGEETGGEGVTGTDGRDDVDVEGGDGRDRVRSTARRPREDGDAVGAPLDDQDVGFGQGRAYGVGAVEPPCLLRLVVPDEDEVAAAGEGEQDVRALLGVAPEAGAVVDVEGDQRAAVAGAVRSWRSARQSAESAAVMPDRCRTRAERRSSYGTLCGDIAEAADPAR